MEAEVNQKTDEELAVLVQPGDFIAIQGRGLFSRLILAAEGTPDGVSHVAVVLTNKPPLVIEVSPPRVRVRPLRLLLANSKKAWVLHDTTLSDTERERMVDFGCLSTGLPYGYIRLFPHGLSATFGTRWFTSHLPSPWGSDGSSDDLKKKSAASPQQPGEWWFRVLFLLLMPFTLPLYAIGLMRALLERLLSSGLFAIVEGGVLFVVGMHFIITPLSKTMDWGGCRFLFGYLWFSWLAFVELDALPGTRRS